MLEVQLVGIRRLLEQDDAFLMWLERDETATVELRLLAGYVLRWREEYR